jgi:tetratricopeptide (TPR) repeat protein
MVETKLGRGKEAIENFRKVVALKPDSSDAHLNLGIALVDQFDRKAGFDEFTKAAQLNPSYGRPHYNLGRFYFETGKYVEARKELEKATRLEPKFASAFYFLALTERQENNFERATELLRKVVALQPDNSDAQFLLGQGLEHLGKTAEAIAHWKMAVKANPNHSEALYSLSRILNKLHDPEAQQFQDRYDKLQRNEQTTDRVANLGNSAIQSANAQDWPRALAQMKEAIAVCGDCGEAAHLRRNLGLMYCRTGNLEDGEKELRAALEIDPSDVDAKKAMDALENLPGASDIKTGVNKN